MSTVLPCHLQSVKNGQNQGQQKIKNHPRYKGELESRMQENFLMESRILGFGSYNNQLKEPTIQYLDAESMA